MLWDGSARISAVFRSEEQRGGRCLEGLAGGGAAGLARNVELVELEQTDALGPSLSTSGETLTIEESMTLRARTENAGHVGDEHEWSWSCG